MSQSRYNTQSCSRADPTASVEGKSPLALAMTNKDSVEFTNILKEFLVDPIIPDELKLNRMTMRIWPYSSESPSQEFKDLLASLPTDLVKLTLAKNGHYIWELFSGKECQRGSLWNLVAKSCDRHEYRAHSSFASAWVIFHSTQNHRIIVCNRADATVAKDCTICSEPCMPHQSPLEIAEERKNPEILRILAEYKTVNREL